MGGVIRGFIGGAGKAAAEAGKMMLADKLSRERSESEALRANELRQETTAGAQEFATKEREAGQEFKSEEAKKERTSKEAIAGMKTEKPQLIKYTTSEGLEQQGVLKSNADGTYNIIKPGTDEIIEERITEEELKNKAAQMNVAEKRGADWIPFNEYSPKDEPVRAAVATEKAGMKGGLVKSAMPKAKTQGKSPYPEGTQLKGKEGKIYVVENGVPVLQNQ